MLQTGRPKRRLSQPRNPERTRERLLQAAFQEIHRSGFQGTDLDSVLTIAGVTKGALYHHFHCKESLGYGVVEEIIRPYMEKKWLQPLQNALDPIDAVVGIIRSTSVRPEHIEYGCPLNNLAQEMSPLDEGFRKRLARIFAEWRDGVVTALREGQKRGLVRNEIDPAETATFLIAAYEGYVSLAKNAQDVRILQSGIETLSRYMESLRAPVKQAKAML